MIALSRDIIKNHSYVKKNKWRKSTNNLSSSLMNKKIGIVGLGNIGKSFAKKAKIFNMKISYFGPNKKNVDYKYYKDLKKMAAEVNFLVITCIGGEKTNKIINASIIKALQKNSYIINVSRGSVVDENALIKSLNNNNIKGAALDVFDNEPDIDPRFKKLPNVILSPHHASGTEETRQKIAELSCQNILKFFDKKKPIYRVI